MATNTDSERNTPLTLPPLNLADRVITSMDHNETPINIYLDLSKAFDTLDHEMLLAKLQYYGIHGTPLELLQSYLTNRKQYVEIEDTKSKMLDKVQF